MLEVEDDYLSRLQRAAEEAQREGAIGASQDIAQLVFELNAYLLLANAQFVLTHERGPPDRARRSIERLLTDSTT